MAKATPEELEQLLRSLPPGTSLTLVTLTEPELRKKSERGMPFPYGGIVRKRTRVRAIVGADYAAAVNARRSAEGKPADFSPAPRKWGEKIPGTPLVRHKGDLYLEYQVAEVLSVEYEHDGRPIDVKALDPWLPARPPGTSQGVDDQVVIRTVKLANVVELLPDVDSQPAA